MGGFGWSCSCRAGFDSAAAPAQTGIVDAGADRGNRIAGFSGGYYWLRRRQFLDDSESTSVLTITATPSGSGAAVQTTLDLIVQ